jgi:transcription termination/antitermination protein NusG
MTLVDTTARAVLLSRLPDARELPSQFFSLAPCASRGENRPLFSSSKFRRARALARGPPAARRAFPRGPLINDFRHGGARANSGGARANAGGARENSGGARAGAGRPRKLHVCADQPRWYLVRAAYGQTAVADRSIREAGYEVFAPTIFKAATPPRRDANGVMRPGKLDRVEFLFVRYVITRFNLADPGWHDIRHLDGVERIISGAYSTLNPIGIPIAIPDEAIAYVREILGPNDCIDPRKFVGEPYELGTSLRMLDGPMAGHIGICDMSDGERVLWVMNMLGRPIPFEVAHDSVEVA